MCGVTLRSDPTGQLDTLTTAAPGPLLRFPPELRADSAAPSLGAHDHGIYAGDGTGSPERQVAADDQQPLEPGAVRGHKHGLYPAAKPLQRFGGRERVAELCEQLGDLGSVIRSRLS